MPNWNDKLKELERDKSNPFTNESYAKRENNVRDFYKDKNKPEKEKSALVQLAQERARKEREAATGKKETTNFQAITERAAQPTQKETEAERSERLKKQDEEQRRYNSTQKDTGSFLGTLKYGLNKLTEPSENSSSSSSDWSLPSWKIGRSNNSNPLSKNIGNIINQRRGQ